MIVLKCNIEGEHAARFECNAGPFKRAEIKLASEQTYRTAQFIQQTLHAHSGTAVRAGDVVCEFQRKYYSFYGTNISHCCKSY